MSAQHRARSDGWFPLSGRGQEADLSMFGAVLSNGQAGVGASGMEAKGRITVNRPVGEVFAYWRDLENLPRFMAHLQSVRSLGEGRSRRRAAGPAGVEVEWDAEVSEHRIDEFIAWRSVGDATVENSGEVEFRPAPGGRGTEIRVRLTYHPLAGKFGCTVAKLFGESPDQQLRDDLRRRRRGRPPARAT